MQHIGLTLFLLSPFSPFLFLLLFISLCAFFFFGFLLGPFWLLLTIIVIIVPSVKEKITQVMLSLNKDEKEAVTIESLNKYEKEPEEAEKFLRSNFKWPVSMPDHYRSFVFWALTDDVIRFEYDNKQKVIEYGQEYTEEQWLELEEKPGAIYLPADLSKYINAKPARAMHAQHINSRDEYTV
ncbi:ATP dependent DNA helicase [Gigaspora margarita]|uniref:ATP dependent DNA helicase n=1 Tax=Gigaspora margarita TaxID=4874 RepID=A0A8H4AL12_GIGMA|nr:ATP dependent DNA helicase [Gigaspora margarita]